MTRVWNDVKWIFEPDGSLRDIYIQDVTIHDWEKLIDLLNTNYAIKYGEDNSNQIDKKYVIKYLKDQTGGMECKSLKIDNNGITIHCHFFLHDQIEFDINPEEIKNIEDYRNMEEFMVTFSKTLKKQVTLSEENLPEFPLIKIDFDKGINKVLTKKEANEIFTRKKSFLTKITSLKARIIMRYFPEKFKEKVLKSVNEPYRATGKEKNLW